MMLPTVKTQDPISTSPAHKEAEAGDVPKDSKDEKAAEDEEGNYEDADDDDDNDILS